MRNDPRAALHAATAKLRRTAASALSEGCLPYKSENGRWVAAPFQGNGWWTGGFWPGLMWLMYAASGDAFFMREARKGEELLTAELRVFENLNHDVGFMYLLSTGADWKLTHDERAKQDTLHAATLLLGRLNPVGFIRAWNGEQQKGYAIIDCMMNLSLLYWASAVTGDPRFANGARLHAETTLREFLRADGSVSHIVEFDPASGERVAEYGGQGYALGSAWSRGQAWALYGFTLTYLNERDERYLAAAERIAAYFGAHIRPDGLTDCDFRQPEAVERLDNIAGAIAACGYLELAKATGKPAYRAQAERLLDGLLDHCVDLSDSVCGLLTRCTASYHDDAAGVHTDIVYGDYFLVEALCKLCAVDPMLWLK